MRTRCDWYSSPPSKHMFSYHISARVSSHEQGCDHGRRSGFLEAIFIIYTDRQTDRQVDALCRHLYTLHIVLTSRCCKDFAGLVRAALCQTTKPDEQSSCSPHVSVTSHNLQLWGCLDSSVVSLLRPAECHLGRAPLQEAFCLPHRCKRLKQHLYTAIPVLSGSKEEWKRFTWQYEI